MLRGLYGRLTTRVILFLTIAMLPIGVIGLYQNQRLVDVVQDRMNLSLLALTEQAVSGEAQVIQQTFGAANALGKIIGTFGKDIAGCRAFVAEYLRVNTDFAFVGYIQSDGRAICSTAATVLDFSAYPDFQFLTQNPQPNVAVNLQAPGSGQSVVIVSEPYMVDGKFEGYTSISLPLSDVGATIDFPGNAEPLSLVTFNVFGELLTSERGRQRAIGTLPRDLPLGDLAQGGTTTFLAQSTDRGELLYSIVPIKPGVVYAMGTWNPDDFEVGRQSTVLSVALPAAMWLASLAIVWMMIDRLVLSDIRTLNNQMDSFAKKRVPPSEIKYRGKTEEMMALHDSFDGMADAIVREEAKLEDRMREKTVLLKEVHHRVKNNLQIVSSIMNMQIRKARAKETKMALRQVQDRIMGLSGVHRTLYQAENLNQADAAQLIEQIVEQTRLIGSEGENPVSYIVQLQSVMVYPDQAVPLAMFVTECLTNAMKYTTGPNPQIEVRLSVCDKNHAKLVIANTCVSESDAADAKSNGLGLQLIKAFSGQLAGDVSTKIEDGQYKIEMTFEVQEFQSEPLEY